MAKKQPKRISKVQNARSRLTARQAWLLSGVALISFDLWFGGYNVITTWLAYKDSHAQALQNNTPNQDSNPLVTGTPVNISIPSVNIDLKVLPGYYYPSTKSWTLSLDEAHWGVMTAQANNKSGATFIYGHNRKQVFSSLPKIKERAEAIVTTNKGHSFKYRFVNSSVTSPNDTSLFSYEGKPVLILQTCTGLWYQDRQLFVFDFIKVS
jgi:LPXTG-site transpeptidase (sortase) family protein